MKHAALLLLALASACKLDRSLGAGPHSIDSPSTDAAATDDATDPGPPIFDAPPWDWQETTNLGPNDQLAFAVIEHDADLYTVGGPTGIQSFPKAGGAPTPFATPHGTAIGQHGLAGDALGLVYLTVTHDVVAQPWGGAAIVVGAADAAATTIAADATSIYVMSQLRIARYPRTGGAGTTLHTAADPACGFFGPLLVDADHVYYQALYANTPGCPSTTTPPFWYFGRVPVGGGALSFAQITANSLWAAGDGVLVGAGETTVVQAPAAGGPTTPLYASIWAGIAPATIVIHGGFIYSAGMQVPVGTANYSEVVCTPLAGGPSTVLSRGRGLTQGLAVDADHVYFDTIYDDVATGTGSHLRSVPACH